jgi:hypothetical protein
VPADADEVVSLRPGREAAGYRSHSGADQMPAFVAAQVRKRVRGATDRLLARPTRFERATPAFGGQYYIQLSYGRVREVNDSGFQSAASTCVLSDLRPSPYNLGSSMHAAEG